MSKSEDQKNQGTIKANREAILKELESVRHFLKEDGAAKDTSAATAPQIDTEEKSAKRPEFQIPLLDPAKSTTFDVDFPKAQPKKNVTLEIPTIDNITQSGSLFNDDDDDDEQSVSKKSNTLTKIELKEQAQLIIQDLLNDTLSEIEEKLADMLPDIEEKLKKQLKKTMDEYIESKL